ncbi:hypothetical protein SD81_040455 [Tolypothrix campylonemoides VB511288]|nr:hypothetical protein SD81_040455 [Tolypothrix campylonemoides VB511288]
MTNKQCCEIFNSSTLPWDTLPSHIEFVARQLVEQSINDPWDDVSFTIYDTIRAGVLPPGLQPKGFLDFILRN